MRKDSYGLLFIRGLSAGLAGIIFITYVFQSSSGFSVFSISNPLNSNAFFYLFVVGPSEEMIFRFFVPLVIMVFADTSYIVGGIAGGIMFGFAHYWAYGGNTLDLITAIVAGMWLSIIVWQFSMKKEGKFTFMPGLLAAMLAHGLYDYLVTTMPGMMLIIGAAMAMILLASYVIPKVEEDLE
ncbi:MAG: CPBP family glutamic-type intramembrane protease [Nitrososphaeria archaeon]